MPVKSKSKKGKTSKINIIETISINRNGFPQPKKVKCFQCRKTFVVKYVVPHKSYSRVNNWEYWTDPNVKNLDFWKDKESRKKDRYICNSDLLKFYYNKETYWETITDPKVRGKLKTYISSGTIRV